MSTKPFLVVAYDHLGQRMAGPAIRSLALAGELARTMPVEVLFEGEEPAEGVKGVSFVSRESVKVSGDFWKRYRAALAPPLVALTFPELLESDLPIVIDLFDPVVWENLELYSREPVGEREFHHERHLAALLTAFFRGDYFLAAGARQQDLFLGALMALNRVNPATWVQGEGPEQMVGLVPFGMPTEPPPSRVSLPEPAGFKGPGSLIVWGGGMWDWLKPETAIEAWPEILSHFPGARLAFPGTEHPNPHVPGMASVGRVKAMAKDRGFESTLVFSTWLPRNEYLGLLAMADCGVCAHGPGLEGQYAVRTRFLDAIWMGLPLVVTSGDEYSELLKAHGVAIVVEPLDVVSFAHGVIEVLEAGRAAYASKFDGLRSELTWRNAAKGLVEWAESPRETHGEGIAFFQDVVGQPSPRGRPSDPASLLRRAASRFRRK